MKFTTVVFGLTAMISGSLAAAVPALETSGLDDMLLQGCAWDSCDQCISFCWNGIACPPNPRQCNTVRFVCLSSCGYTGCCNN